MGAYMGAIFFYHLLNCFRAQIRRRQERIRHYLRWRGRLGRRGCDGDCEISVGQRIVLRVARRITHGQGYGKNPSGMYSPNLNPNPDPDPNP